MSEERNKSESSRASGGPCRMVVGIAGRVQRVDYRAASLADRIRTAMPDGIEVYSDGAGGAPAGGFTPGGNCVGIVDERPDAWDRPNAR